MKNFARIENKTRGTVVCPQCRIADTMLARVRGLMWRAPLQDGEGLFISDCPSIHMFNVGFAIDAIFLTKENIVTDFVENIAPRKIYVAKANAGKPYAAVEVVAGTIARTQTQIGDVLSFAEIQDEKDIAG